MNDQFQQRRAWFEAYCQRLNEGVHQEAQAGVDYPCPCCGYPTLSELGGFEICDLCGWEDDGQDDPYADEVWGGPNKMYSLTAARENFKLYWCKYKPEEDTRIGGPDSETEVQAKKDACAAFNQMIGADDATRETLMRTVNDCFATLDAELHRKIDEYSAKIKKERGLI